MSNSSNSATATSSGIEFFGLLTIVFAIAKLWGHFPYSWWWVFSPLWIPALVTIGIAIIIIVVALIVDFVHDRKVKKNRKAFRNRGR